MAIKHERKWKYLSITLGALVAALVLTPQANAANPDHNDIVAAISAAVTTIQGSIASSATETQTNLQSAISASAGETQDNVGTVHAISLDDTSINPADGSSSSLHIFGSAGGPSNSGQITFNIGGPLGTGDSENRFVLLCDVSDSRAVEFEFTAAGSYTQDFTCTLLNIVVYDNAGGSQAGPVTIDGLLQYTTAVDTITISVDIP